MESTEDVTASLGLQLVVFFLGGGGAFFCSVRNNIFLVSQFFSRKPHMTKVTMLKEHVTASTGPKSCFFFFSPSETTHDK